MNRFRSLVLFSLVFAISSVAAYGFCPFCSAVSQTFSEEMKTMDVVAITELVDAALIKDLNTTDPTAEVPKSRFKINKVIKGDKFVKEGDTFDTIYFGEATKGKPFLAMATDAPSLMWSTPLILNERAEAYLLKLKLLPDGAERLVFFQDYLEDKDEMLARDAYDEFAKAPYEDVIALKPKMQREKLLGFIEDPNVPSNRRRLYFTMLGVCGTSDDAKLLEDLMASTDRKKKAGLDAMLACYVILKGESGLAHVEGLFLGNKDAEYADTYAAIMAIRFHASQVEVVPRVRLNKSLRLMLDRPELADLVIPDLARAEDWEVMPRLVKLFKDADDSSSWVRVPVVNYLRACPLPKAKEYIDELTLVDADAVKRAMTFFPLTPKKEKSDDGSATKAEAPGPAASSFVPQKTDMLVAAVIPENASPLPAAVRDSEIESTKAELPTSPVAIQQNDIARLETTVMPPPTLHQVEELAEKGANIWLLFGVMLGSGVLCLVAMRSLLGVGQQG